MCGVLVLCCVHEAPPLLAHHAIFSFLRLAPGQHGRRVTPTTNQKLQSCRGTCTALFLG